MDLLLISQDFAVIANPHNTAEILMSSLTEKTLNSADCSCWTGWELGLPFWSPVSVSLSLGIINSINMQYNWYKLKVTLPIKNVVMVIQRWLRREQWKQTSPWSHKTGVIASIFLSEKSHIFLTIIPLISSSCWGHEFLFLLFSPPFCLITHSFSLLFLLPRLLYTYCRFFFHLPVPDPSYCTWLCLLNS